MAVIGAVLGWRISTENLSAARGKCRASLGLLVFWLLLVALGCGSPSPEVSEIQVLLLAVHPVVASSTGGLPDDIVALGLPWRAEKCGDTVFRPEVSVLRPRHGTDYREVLKTRETTGLIPGIRSLYGAPGDFARMRGEAERILRSQPLSAELREPDDLDTGEWLERHISTGPEDRVLMLSKAASNTGPERISGHLIVSGDVELLRIKISEARCTQREPQTTKPEYMVVYGYRGGAPASVPVVGRITSSRCDQFYIDLKSDVGRVDEAGRKTTDERLMSVENTSCLHDYRFPYLRAVLAAGYGRSEHEPAFTQLFAAAERAIANYETGEMAETMRRDGMEGGAFHHLVMHSEWNDILKALVTKNPAIVRR